MIYLLADTITSEEITINTTVGQVVAWLIVGLLAGVLASLFYSGRKSMGGVILLGLLGALLGGVLFDLLNITITGSLNNGILLRWIDLLVAFVGSLLILALTNARFLRRL